MKIVYTQKEILELVNGKFQEEENKINEENKKFLDERKKELKIVEKLFDDRFTELCEKIHTAISNGKVTINEKILSVNIDDMIIEKRILKAFNLNDHLSDFIGHKCSCKWGNDNHSDDHQIINRIDITKTKKEEVRIPTNENILYDTRREKFDKIFKINDDDFIKKVNDQSAIIADKIFKILDDPSRYQLIREFNPETLRQTNKILFSMDEKDIIIKDIPLGFIEEKLFYLFFCNSIKIFLDSCTNLYIVEITKYEVY